jgi:hypothetical protein
MTKSTFTNSTEVMFRTAVDNEQAQFHTRIGYTKSGVLKSVSRRQFLRTVAVASLTVAPFAAASPAQVLSRSRSQTSLRLSAGASCAKRKKHHGLMAQWRERA